MSLERYADKYFPRSKKILQKDGLNPWVRAQIFVRKGPGIISGLDEAVQLIKDNSKIKENKGKIYALKDEDEYNSKETLMVLEAPINDIIELETTYLGVLSKGMTLRNDGVEPSLKEIENKTRRIVSKIGDRSLMYFGGRHWHYEMDAAISAAAFRGGAVAASTDAGAAVLNKKGVGTIPHVLENIYAFEYGMENAVVEATKAFDKYMPESIPRVALIDYNNKEIDDSLAVANALEGRLSMVRVDTCGENIAQGALETFENSFFDKNLSVPDEYKKYWAGTGVSISGVYSLRMALDKSGYDDVGILLTSGFGDENKVDAFVDAEKRLGIKLFDGLGVGSLYKSRAATMDVVGAKKRISDDYKLISKVGRTYRPNVRLMEV